MIVHIITGLRRGGAEQVLFRLLSQQSDPTQALVISLTDGGVFKERLENLGVHVTCLQMRAGLPSPIKWWRLVRLLRQWRPQLVQTWMYHADLLGGLAAQFAGIPVCWGIRQSDLSASHTKRSTRLTASFCARVSRWVPARAISCSTRAAQVHRALGYRMPFEIVHNGVDAGPWQPVPALRLGVRNELGLAAQSFVLAHAGRDDPQKDHANLAAAFNQLHAARPDARLLLCGQGLVPGHGHFDALPFTPDARAAVIALGPRDDLPRLWQAADAFVLSSLGEAFPNVVAEAMAAALPCVVTDVGDAAEIVGDTGLVVPPSDSNALAEAMLAMARMPEAERSELGRAARARVMEHFTLERMAAGFARVWDAILQGRGQTCAD
ncbi:glycosyltransferase [Pseudoxanthomonas koreensis]|uniref:glycosyltransferase n=1 Tax=Pseudoxanthomonas koreensis TaxID=266061 RepID=UPI0035A65833